MDTQGVPHFSTEDAAYQFIESHVWPNGVTCSHCNENVRVEKLLGDSTRIGVYKCYRCRKPFTVKSGTIFEGTKVPLHIWLQAIYLVAGSQNRASITELHQALQVTRKTAWHMSQRIQHAMDTQNASSAKTKSARAKSSGQHSFESLTQAMLADGRMITADAERLFSTAIAGVIHLHQEWSQPGLDQGSHY